MLNNTQNICVRSGHTNQSSCLSGGVLLPNAIHIRQQSEAFICSYAACVGYSWHIFLVSQKFTMCVLFTHDKECRLLADHLNEQIHTLKPVWSTHILCMCCVQFFIPSRLHSSFLCHYSQGEERGVYRVLVGKPEGRRPLGRSRRRWADNIRMDLQEVGCVYRDWIGLAQDRGRWRTLVSAVMNLRVPWNAGSFLTSCKPVSFSRRTLHHGVSM